MSKFHKWLKDPVLSIWWYVIATGRDSSGKKALLGWVFGGDKGEGPLPLDNKVFQQKIEVPEDRGRFEKRMIRDVFERFKELWFTIDPRSIKYE
jgi:hypothetical protein